MSRELPPACYLGNLGSSPASHADLPTITEIYNYYVIHTPISFDIESFTPEQRAGCSTTIATAAARLLVAEEDGQVAMRRDASEEYSTPA